MPTTVPIDGLPSWITRSQYEVLTQLLDACADLGIPCAATGGLAGNLHGSHWRLHDLDFDVPAHDAAREGRLAPLT